jgi:hypothetical protein
MSISLTRVAIGLVLLSSGLACSSQEAPKATPDSVSLGLACSVNGDCSSGLCIAETRSANSVSWTGGTCSQACVAGGTCPGSTTCVPFADGTYWCLTQCAMAGDCRQGYICSSAVGACLPDCRFGFSCGTSLGCEQTSGACVPGSRAVGAACVLDADCKSGLCTLEQGSGSGKQWEGGYCTQACSSSAPCPQGSSCVTYDDGTSYCASTCAASSDCRGGYVCSGSAKVCLPDCRQGWSCGTTLTCDSVSGSCTGGTPQIGGPCVASTDCTSGLCTPAQSLSAGTVWSGGYCTMLCSASAPCPASAVCIDYSDGSSCVAACVTSADCRAGYVCAAGAGGCLPDCRQGWNCGTELACDVSTGACI